MEPQEGWEKWIPGPRLTAHPGMTGKAWMPGEGELLCIAPE
jgi:hypothetical protein